MLLFKLIFIYRIWRRNILLPLIIMAIENDDEREFMAELYINYYPIIKKTVFGIVNDYNMVEDVINDALVKLIGKISTLRGLKCYQLTTYIVYTSITSDN